MIVIIDERDLVQQGFASQFGNEGFPSAGFDKREFDGWLGSASREDLTSVSACLIGASEMDGLSPAAIREKTNAPVIALLDQSSLEDTLKLFESGVDDVVRKPVHVREIIARIAAIKRRTANKESCVHLDRLAIYLDGRDPSIDNKPFPLPRRERRILEYLASIGDAIDRQNDRASDGNFVRSKLIASPLRREGRSQMPDIIGEAPASLSTF